MSKKKIIIIAVSAIILILGGLGAAWGLGYLDFNKIMGSSDEKPSVVLDKKPSFFPLDEIIIGLKQPGNARFMQLEMSLMSHDPRMEDQVEELDTVIRNTLLQYFSGREQTDVRSEIANIETLQESLKKELIKAAENYKSELSVDRVLLTNIIIQ